MEFEKFAAELKDALAKRLPEFEISDEKVEKLQDAPYDALAVRNGPLGVLMNLNDSFLSFNSGTSIEKILDDFINIVKNKVPPISQDDIESLSDYSKLKDKLAIRLVPVKGNEMILESVPYRAVADLALVCTVVIKETEGEISQAVMTNEHLKALGVSGNKLIEDAIINSEEKRPFRMQTLSSVIFGDAAFEETTDESTLWFITNQKGYFGASVIGYPGVLEQIAKNIGSGYYISPSSVHELIITSDQADVTAEKIDWIVKKVNETLSPSDILSDHSYHYDVESGTLEIAADYEKRVKKGE